MNIRIIQTLILSWCLLLVACNGGGSSDSGNADVATDITNATLDSTNPDCAYYAATYTATAVDINNNSTSHTAAITITSSDSSCTLTSNSTPNHDFNDGTDAFPNAFAEIDASYTITRSPALAGTTTALDHTTINAVLLNGAAVDLLSAGCFSPGSTGEDAGGNINVGCSDTEPWLLDPMYGDNHFTTDTHHAHTQPDGFYHYHGDPSALFDSTGQVVSPVIGFAADGFPIFGSYFMDSTGAVRQALSSYQLKSGSRVAVSGLNPSDTQAHQDYNGAEYNGKYIADYEYVDGLGDLDECNGMTVDGQYGYYVTATYPWIMACFKGTPDASFNK